MKLTEIKKSGEITMEAKELVRNINYTGQEKALRRLVIREKLAKGDDVALMTLTEVCDVVCKHYECVYVENENFGLVEKNKMKEYNEIVKNISR